MREPMDAKQKRYKALTGLHYPATAKDVTLRKAGKPCKVKDVEKGEVVTDIPPESIPWLLRGGKIEAVD